MHDRGRSLRGGMPMKSVVQLTDLHVVELSIEECDLLSDMHLNAVKARHTSWRISCFHEQLAEKEYNKASALDSKEYRETIELDLSSICQDLIGMFENRPTVAQGFLLKNRNRLNRYYQRVTATLKAQIGLFSQCHLGKSSMAILAIRAYDCMEIESLK